MKQSKGSNLATFPEIDPTDPLLAILTGQFVYIRLKIEELIY
jgi:hypothetical protein